MADLATAMGRVQTLGHELGVSIEELESSLVTLSISGVKANEAGTQVRSMMMGLLKPTKMKEAFQQLGVESGPALVATYGWSGALAQLQKVGGAAANQIAALLPNQRALIGELRIGGEGGLSKYAESLKALTEVSPQTLIGKRLTFTSTDAEQVTRKPTRSRTTSRPSSVRTSSTR